VPKTKTNIEPVISYTDVTINHPSGHQQTHDAPEKTMAVIPAAASLITPGNREVLAKEMKNRISDGCEHRGGPQPLALEVLLVPKGCAEPAGSTPDLIQALIILSSTSGIIPTWNCVGISKSYIGLQFINTSLIKSCKEAVQKLVKILVSRCRVFVCSSVTPCSAHLRAGRDSSVTATSATSSRTHLGFSLHW
jgi:hypothetical protein